ncbi:MAG: nucleotidyltransferase domain-containing protein [FCB group bacterium]|jgi:predicted nucleotidyltransferase
MAEMQYIINNLLSKYYNLVKEEFDVFKVVLYGSYAYGKPHKDSDIDVAIVINSPKKIDRFDVNKRLYILASDVDLRIEPRCYSKKELDEAEPASILAYIMKHGKEIKFN